MEDSYADTLDTTITRLLDAGFNVIISREGLEGIDGVDDNSVGIFFTVKKLEDILDEGSCGEASCGCECEEGCNEATVE